MIDLATIRQEYPEHLHDRGAFLLREYLQYEILKIIFDPFFVFLKLFFGRFFSRFPWIFAHDLVLIGLVCIDYPSVHGLLISISWTKGTALDVFAGPLFEKCALSWATSEKKKII